MRYEERGTGERLCRESTCYSGEVEGHGESLENSWVRNSGSGSGEGDGCRGWEVEVVDGMVVVESSIIVVFTRPGAQCFLHCWV